MTTNDGPLLGVIAALRWSCHRDLRVLLRNRADPLLALVFFVLVTTLFPLSVSPVPSLLTTIAPGIVWIAALLSLLLGLPRMFAHDHVDGTLEQMVLASAPLPALIAGKVLAHWIAHCLPVVLLSPLIGLQFGLPPEAIGLLMLTLLLGLPILSWLGAVTSALTLGSRGGSALLALLILPLAIPVLIFGTTAIDSQQAGLGVSAHLSLLSAGCLGALVLGPVATALAVRIAFE